MNPSDIEKFRSIFFGNARNQTQGCWVRSKNSTSVLCSPPSITFLTNMTYFSISASSRPQDCVWSSWGAWSSCSITCGPGPGTQRRTRAVQIHPTPGGAQCANADSFETILCSIDEDCPESDPGLTTIRGERPGPKLFYRIDP